MSARKVVPILAVLLIAGLLAAGCAKPPAATPTPPTPRPKPSVVTPPPPAPTAEKVVYFCTMHPEVTSDKPGKCTKCPMDLVAGVYTCEMHPGVQQTEPGKCPQPGCGMDLKLVTIQEAQKALAATKAKAKAEKGVE